MIQSGRILKIGQRDLSCRSAPESGRAACKLTVPSVAMVIDCAVGRNRDLRLKQIAVRGHEAARRVQMKGAAASISVLAAGLLDLKKAVALDHDSSGLSVSAKSRPAEK